MMREWRIEIEIPALNAISDESSWVAIRGGTFDNREDAIEAYQKAKQMYEWPLRLMQHVDLQDEEEDE